MLTSLEVENPAEFLRNRYGIFKVTSPFGQIFQVTCQKGRNMRIREIGAIRADDLTSSKRWRIQKMNREIA